MPGKFPIAVLCLAISLGHAVANAAGASPLLDEAVKKYYEGRTAEAIDMIRPLATAGDVDAQYLLGNILYTLASSGQGDVLEDPSVWYRMAAVQDSAPANYALGVIHNNRWLRSHRDEDARLARSYLQRALELGEPKARSALDRLAKYRQTGRNAVSLSYTNADFSGERKPESKAQASAAASTDSAPGGFEGSGDTVADAEKLRELLQRLQNGEQPEQTNDGTGMPGGFESVDKLISHIIRLLVHIDQAAELGTAPDLN
jgi:hypothetical protein